MCFARSLPSEILSHCGRNRQMAFLHTDRRPTENHRAVVGNQLAILKVVQASMFWSSARTDGARPDGRSKSCRHPRKQPLKKKVAASGRVTSPGCRSARFSASSPGRPPFPQSRLATGRAARPQPEARRILLPSPASAGTARQPLHLRAIDRGARLRVAASEALHRWSVCPEFACRLVRSSRFGLGYCAPDLDCRRCSSDPALIVAV